MKKETIVFDKKYIESFAKPLDNSQLEEFQNYVCNILNDCTFALQKTSVNIAEFGILFVGDSVAGCEVQDSQMDVFMVIKSPKLEFSTVKIVNNWYKKFLKKLKYAWNHRKDKKKLSRRERRKRKKELEKQTIPVMDEKYNIEDFRLDFMKKLTEYFLPTTFIRKNNFCLNIYGKDDLIMPVNIYITLNNNDVIKLFDEKRYNFITIDFRQRYMNIGKKIDETNSSFRDVLRIYNALYLNLMEEKPNMIMLESLLYNCPNNLFTDDIYQSFLNTANYLFVTSIFQLKSVCDENTKLVNESLCKGDLSQISRFLKLIKECLE